MSMYGLVFGKSPNAKRLLALLGLSEGDFYRFRDCYLTEGGHIAVYTRGGGGNRECWSDECERGNHADDCVVTIQHANRRHPLYLEDEDDDFDRTYATFYFRVPEEADRTALEGINPELKRDDAWREFIAALDGDGDS